MTTVIRTCPDSRLTHPLLNCDMVITMKMHLGLLLILLPGLAAAQATVEYGLGAGASATGSAASSKATGKAIGGAFGNLTRTLQKSGDTKPATEHVAPLEPAQQKAAAPQSASAKPETPAPVWEDPSGIHETMEYAEVLQRFGPPTLKLTLGRGQESLNYVRKSVAVDVTLLDGKVTEVRKTTQAEHGIVRLQ
jgi:hypothetical protein